MSGAKKRDLPVKVCLVCGLPFRWHDDWESVVYCSLRCRPAPQGPGRRTRRG